MSSDLKPREETGIVVHEVSAGIPLMPHFDVHVRLNINHCKLGCHIKRELEFLAAAQPGTSLGEREIVWKENPLTSVASAINMLRLLPTLM